MNPKYILKFCFFFWTINCFIFADFRKIHTDDILYNSQMAADQENTDLEIDLLLNIV